MPDAATATTLAEPLLPAADAAALPLSPPSRDRTADASPCPRGRGDAGGAGSAASAAGGPPADPVKTGPPSAGAGAAPPAAGTGGADDDDDDGSGGAFDCNVCYDVAREPVVTLCGHLYCWPCLYR